MRLVAQALAFAVASTLACVASPWPGWRGPDGNGVCRERNLPIHWSATENIHWRVPLPERGNSTPIVWGDRVFITQAVENRRSVMCFERQGGRLLWQSGETREEKEVTYPDNPPCTPSPVTDGKRVIAWFGTAGVHCFDFEGRELWRRDLGRPTHSWGYASSPVLYHDLCILNFGPGERSFVIALDKNTGTTVWRQDAPVIGPDAKWEDFGGDSNPGGKPSVVKVSEIAGSWATPLMVPAGRHGEVVVAFALRLEAFAPKTGQLLWTCDGPNIGAYSSPFFGEGIVGLNASGLRNTLLAVRPGGRGDVTASHRLWLHSTATGKACIGAGLIYQSHIYQVNTGGFFECRDLITGRLLWEERLVGSGARNSSWSSPVLAGDRIYAANQNADVFVLRANPVFQCLATNSIGGELMNASLAISDGAIFLRTEKALWCIAESGKRGGAISR